MLQPGLAEMRPERVYAFDEIVPVSAAGSAGHGRAVRVTDGAWSAWLIAMRTFNDLSAADGARLSSFTSHLAIAMRNFAALERARVRLAVAEDAMERAGLVAFTLDPQGRVVTQIGATSSPIAVERASKEYTAQERERRAAPHVIHVGPSSALAYGSDVTGLAHAGIASVVLARTPRMPTTQQAVVLQQIWGLSPSEARLTLAVASGQSLAEAAVSMGVTEETARNYSKKIYAKTGSRGMPDLVRRVLTSVCTLA
jgi:DNA-binding CsgD family transcriptional regulator